jgi:L-ascorbate metabolism protein UlaG (beta-lactamase superfamily)
MVRSIVIILLIGVGLQFIGGSNCAARVWGEADSGIPQDPTGIEFTSKILKKEQAEGEAYAWYLFHCGWAVKTSSKLLIFDYTRGLWRYQVEPPVRSLSNGWINPEEIKDLDVYVFVSHSHHDHYDSTIFNWKDTIASITYFFGWSEAAGQAYNNMVGPRATFVNDDIEVYTINSHHSGVPEVAYLVKTDDMAIYHGGDYNADYKADFAYLKTCTDDLDVAMMNDWCGDPIMEPINNFNPKLILPGHFGAKEHEARKLPSCYEALGLSGEVKCARQRGDMFKYDPDQH